MSKLNYDFCQTNCKRFEENHKDEKKTYSLSEYSIIKDMLSLGPNIKCSVSSPRCSGVASDASFGLSL